MFTKPRENWDLFALSSRSLPNMPGRNACSRWLAASILLASRLALAQEAIRNSIAGEAAAEARRLHPELLSYTVKQGDFRLLATPSLGLDWNDNINTSKSDRQDDFILKPSMGFVASYPVTEQNMLQFNVTVGYSEYLKHDELSTWELGSASELSFDIFVKDVLINLHDRFNYLRDPGREPSVASTARYGNLNNTAGLLMTWDLEDLTLSFGYDHANVYSPASEFQSQDHSSELLVGRAGFKVHPRLTLGTEVTAAFTSYDQMAFNDNANYSLGAYGDWQPGSYLHVQPRFGYTIVQFQQNVAGRQSEDLNSWYANLAVIHQVNDIVSYTLSAGHEIRLGIQSETIDDWYFRPSINWSIVKNLNFLTFLSFEHGKQGLGNLTGKLTETYDWLGTGFAISHPLTKRLTVGLNYHLTLRSSNIDTRGYDQNIVGIQLTYVIQ
jgi:hypothetical protein